MTLLCCTFTAEALCESPRSRDSIRLKTHDSHLHHGSLDTGASVQEWFGHLTKELSFKRGLKVSVFSLDYGENNRPSRFTRYDLIS